MKQLCKCCALYSYAISLVVFLLAAGFMGQAQVKRDLLVNTFSKQVLSESMIKLADWKPYPQVSDRKAWMNVDGKFRTQCVKEADSLLTTSWIVLPAFNFREYTTNGNRTRYEKILFDRRQKVATLVLAEAMQRNGKYLNEIMNGVWAICEETYWGVPAHVGAQKAKGGLPDVTEPTIDLFAAETGSLIAWTYYLLHDQLDSITPQITQRMRYEVDRRIITPGLQRDDFWWMGLDGTRLVNNWNPWICSNWLACVLFMETNEERRVASVYKIMRCLDQFINVYNDDGGCDEGPSYWGHAAGSLFDCLWLISNVTNGKISLFDNPVIKAMGSYIYKVNITNNLYVNFADASLRTGHNPYLIYEYGKFINDKQMMAFGRAVASLEKEIDIAHYAHYGSLQRSLRALFISKEFNQLQPTFPYLADAWLSGIQVMTAREEGGSTNGFFVAALGGHNDESHNHNDVGSFVVFYDGLPVIIDAGVGEYTSKTFSNERYTIWTMQSANHNLPTINGIMQKEGRQFAAKNVAFASDNKQVRLTLDISGAYPKDAMVKRYFREIQLNRGKDVKISDAYSLTRVLRPLEMNLMTASDIEKSGAGWFILNNHYQSKTNKPLKVQYDGRLFDIKIEKIEIKDSRLSPIWGNRLTKIIFVEKQPKTEGKFWLQFTD